MREVTKTIIRAADTPADMGIGAVVRLKVDMKSQNSAGLSL